MNRHRLVLQKANKRVTRRGDVGVELQRQILPRARREFHVQRGERHVRRVAFRPAAHAQFRAQRRCLGHVQRELHQRHRPRLHRQHHAPRTRQRQRLTACGEPGNF